VKRCFNYINSKKGLVGALAGLGAMSSQAAIDTTTSVAAVTAAESSVEAIALAIIGLAVVAMVGRWLKAQFF
jgi:mannose/fructose/N-acetylgalactosamine-specific phosphotransferase system component IID